MKLNKQVKNKQSEWFEKSIGTRFVYVPTKISNLLNIEKNGKYAVFLKEEGIDIVFPARANLHKVYGKSYYSLYIPYEYQKLISKNKRHLIKILTLDNIKRHVSNQKEDFINIANVILENTNEFYITKWINKNEIIIWNEKIHPQTSLILPKFIKLEEDIIKYLGFYFADGHKTQYFRIYAPCKELAKFVFRVHKRIIKSHKLSSNLLFTKLNSDKRDNPVIKDCLYDYWKKFIKKENITILPNKTKLPEKASKHSKMGILKIQDSRLIPLMIHKLLIKQLYSLIDRDKNIALKFFEGAADGDIYVSDTPNNSFRYFQIATNDHEVYFWRKLCKILNLKSFEYKRKGTCVVMHVGDYYNACLMYLSGIFENYSKRRNKLKISLRNRIETKILKELKINSYIGVSKFSRYFSIYKNNDLLKYGLINKNNDKISLTKEGERFINRLENTEIMKVD